MKRAHPKCFAKNTFCSVFGYILNLKPFWIIRLNASVPVNIYTKLWDISEKNEKIVDLSLIFFYNQKRFIPELKHGVFSLVFYKEERASYYREYRKTHKEEVAKHSKKYNDKHKERRKIYNKKYNESHKKEIREYNRENKDKINARRRERRRLKSANYNSSNS